MKETRFPLAWPVGWRRTDSDFRTPARFGKKGEYGLSGVTVAEAVRRLLHEFSIMGVSEQEVTISTNIELRQDGLPCSNRKASPDPGAAVYWIARTNAGKKQRCMAIDRYNRVEGNLAAIAATLYAMRVVDRHGGAEILDRAFTGFVALAAPEQWFEVLKIKTGASKVEIENAYRILVAKHHPDRGGDSDLMARINRARDQGMEQFE